VLFNDVTYQVAKEAPLYASEIFSGYPDGEEAWA
jgi:hypothetical protein